CRESTRGLTTASRLLVRQMRGALVAGDVMTTTAGAEGAARIGESADPDPRSGRERSETGTATRPGATTPGNTVTHGNTGTPDNRRPHPARQTRQEIAPAAQPPSPGAGVRRRLARLGAQRGSSVNPVLEPLIKTIRAHHPKADVRTVERAYEVAAHWHKDQ